MTGPLWFVFALGALLAMFAAGLRAPLSRGRWRGLNTLVGVVVALAAIVAANVVVYKHDTHVDVTREQAFTPAPETLAVLRALDRDVELVYFYQAQNPAGRAAKQMVELMARETPRLKVRTIDPDQQPALANRYGVRMYNVALLAAEGQRVEVVTTEDREMALGILRLLRRDLRPVCFVAGHGEYDPDNFEFHTHFEGSNAHQHDAAGMAVVKMEQHGIGRLRRALEKLGYAVRKFTPATVDAVPSDCSTLVVANPRTAFAPNETALIERYLAQGGNALFLLEPDFVPGPDLERLLARVGVSVGAGVVTDPTSHYFTDEQMVAVEKYAQHPATLGLALSFFPGARPLAPVAAEGVRTSVLFASSATATVATRPGLPPIAGGDRAAVRALALASEGRLGEAPFKVAVVGDADFASNSFYPYLANADLALGLVAWLRGEPRGPAMKPPVEVLPEVVLTNGQMQAIFLLCVVAIPGVFALAGLGIWWRRRF